MLLNKGEIWESGGRDVRSDRRWRATEAELAQNDPYGRDGLRGYMQLCPIVYSSIKKSSSLQQKKYIPSILHTSNQ